MELHEINDNSTNIFFNNISSTTADENSTEIFLLNQTVEISTQRNIDHLMPSTLNLSKINDTLEKIDTSTTNVSLCTTVPATSTEYPFDNFGPPDGIEYIFVPVGVMIFVIILSATVLIISRKRKLERLRHRLMPLYNFDPGEEGEDDWETELLDEGFNSRQRRVRYQTMDDEENVELFTPVHSQSSFG
uniref:Uncharacterized protein n=1 Tax=Trichogramma kaykai TaxID=54128 RepID=A0ABD2W8R4_9HYME